MAAKSPFEKGGNREICFGTPWENPPSPPFTKGGNTIYGYALRPPSDLVQNSGPILAIQVSENIGTSLPCRPAYAPHSDRRNGPLRLLFQPLLDRAPYGTKPKPIRPVGDIGFINLLATNLQNPCDVPQVLV